MKEVNLYKQKRKQRQWFPKKTSQKINAAFYIQPRKPLRQHFRPSPLPALLLNQDKDKTSPGSASAPG